VCYNQIPGGYSHTAGVVVKQNTGCYSQTPGVIGKKTIPGVIIKHWC
jgi:hypothetical protein